MPASVLFPHSFILCKPLKANIGDGITLLGCGIKFSLPIDTSSSFISLSTIKKVSVNSFCSRVGEVGM